MRILSICLNPAIDISSEAESIYPVSKVRTCRERVSPGGGGVNVARVLGNFGVRCELVYLAGGGTGRMLEDEIDQLGIDSRCFQIDNPTRVAFNVRQTSNNQEYRFVPEGPLVNEAAYNDLMKYLEETPLSDEDILIASGSLPRGVPEDTYSRIAHIAQRQGARLILDSSGAGLSTALDAGNCIYLVKPSLNELQRLAGRKLDENDARDFASSLITEGKAEHVAVSMGSHGAFLVGKHSTLRLPAYLVKVVSTVGAGDSFVGAMVYSLSEGHSIETAFRYGVAAGAAAVMTSGDELCRREDVESLYRVEDQQAEL